MRAFVTQVGARYDNSANTCHLPKGKESRLHFYQPEPLCSLPAQTLKQGYFLCNVQKNTT